MKKSMAIWTCVLLGACQSARAAYVSEVLADNPVAYWRMNDTSGTQITDYLGLNHGVYGAGVGLGQAGAALGTGTSVALGTGTIQVPDSSALDLSSKGAVEGWFYIPSESYGLNEDYTLMIKGDNFASSVSYGISLSARDNGLKIRFWVDSDGTWGPAHYVGMTSGGTEAAATGAWYHIVGEWDANGTGTNAIDSTRLYVNGVDAKYGVFDNAAYPNAYNSAVPLNVGSGVPNFLDMPGTARFDELAIYGEPIGLDRALAHYNAAFVPEPSSLVLMLFGMAGLWRMARRQRTR